MNFTIKKTTRTIVSAKLRKLQSHISEIPFTNSLKRFTKPKHFPACNKLFSSLCYDFFVKLFLFPSSDPAALDYSDEFEQVFSSLNEFMFIRKDQASITCHLLVMIFKSRIYSTKNLTKNHVLFGSIIKSIWIWRMLFSKHTE